MFNKAALAAAVLVGLALSGCMAPVQEGNRYVRADDIPVYYLDEAPAHTELTKFFVQWKTPENDIDRVLREPKQTAVSIGGDALIITSYRHHVDKDVVKELHGFIVKLAVEQCVASEEEASE